MVNRTGDKQSADQKQADRQETFIVRLEPVNEFTTTDDLERKLRLMMAGCGIKTVSAEPVAEGGEVV